MNVLSDKRLQRANVDRDANFHLRDPRLQELPFLLLPCIQMTRTTSDLDFTQCLRVVKIGLIGLTNLTTITDNEIP